jgi:hypothetical protein
MADPALRAVTIALALVTGACGGQRAPQPHGSIRVKLPAPRPAVAKPGFRDEDAILILPDNRNGSDSSRGRAAL